MNSHVCGGAQRRGTQWYKKSPWGNLSRLISELSYERQVGASQVKMAEKRETGRGNSVCKNPCCRQERGRFMWLKDDHGGRGREKAEGHGIAWSSRADTSSQKPLKVLQEDGVIRYQFGKVMQGSIRESEPLRYHIVYMCMNIIISVDVNTCTWYRD